MRIVLSNGRQFIVKLRYVNDYHSTQTKDKFGRYVYTEWDERTTMVTISEWFKKEPKVSTVVVGKSTCNYQDKYDKRIGKGLAYFRALQELQKNGIITEYESEEMAAFELNAPVYKCVKIEHPNCEG